MESLLRVPLHGAIHRCFRFFHPGQAEESDSNPAAPARTLQQNTCSLCPPYGSVPRPQKTNPNSTASRQPRSRQPSRPVMSSQNSSQLGLKRKLRCGRLEEKGQIHGQETPCAGFLTDLTRLVKRLDSYWASCDLGPVGLTWGLHHIWCIRRITDVDMRDPTKSPHHVLVFGRSFIGNLPKK